MTCPKGWRAAWEESPKSSMPSISEASHGSGKNWESRASRSAQTFKTTTVARGISAGMEALPGFLLAGVALAGSPGPATLSLAAAGAAFGARRVVGYFIGIVAGMVAVMAITASGP